MAAVVTVRGTFAGSTRLVLARHLSASAAAPKNMKKVAVVLSGCGVYDGSEIHEASAALVHLSRSGADVGMYAPDCQQMHVVDHCKGQPVEGEARNVLVESARIARGNISPLSSLTASGYHAVVFPGGFGAAKNLSTFATEGAAMTVNADVERVLKEFHSAEKPIGLCCISPILVAKLLPGVKVTIGSDQDPVADAINSMGGKHIHKEVTEAHTDAGLSVVTTPAFMCEAPLHSVYDGIGRMISEVMRLIK